MSSPIASSASLSESSSVGSLGLYVPVHKRANSSSSKATSPSREGFPSISGDPHSRVYSPEFLLSLRPTADDGVREKMRAACPEVVMNRRTRKNLEFSQHQHEASERKVHHPQQPSSPPTTIMTAAPVALRARPHRNRHSGRASERRHQAFESRFNWNDSWSRVSIPLQRLSIVIYPSP